MAEQQESPMGGLSLGEVILILCSRKGMKLTELSRESGVPMSTLSRYRRGTRDIPAKTLKAIADALEVTPSYLLDCASGLFLNPTERPKPKGARSLPPRPHSLTA